MLINLHTHLEGRIRPSTAVELANELDITPPTGATSWAEALELSEPADLTTYLAKVAASYPFFSSRDRIVRLASEAVEDAAADGTDYLELRFGPATHSMTSPLTFDDVVEAVCDGIAEGTARTGMPAAAIVCALRHHDTEINNAVAETAAKFGGSGVVGFDLAGDEQRFPSLRSYVEAFQIARAAGLGLTCHAAEAADGEAAQEAVRLFGVRRIGHGVHIAKRPDLLDWCRDEGIVIECCPTSNWFTGGVADLNDHPVRTFFEAGVSVVLGDDNPRQTRTQLSDEHRLLSGSLGFSPADLGTIERTSVRSAFVDEPLRVSLTARLPRL